MGSQQTTLCSAQNVCFFCFYAVLHGKSWLIIIIIKEISPLRPLLPDISPQKRIAFSTCKSNVKAI